MTISATTSTIPTITGKSSWLLAFRSERPMPGRPKVCSMKTAVAKARPRSMPRIVTIGSKLFRMAWRTTTRSSDRPFALAVRT